MINDILSDTKVIQNIKLVSFDIKSLSHLSNTFYHTLEHVFLTYLIFLNYIDKVVFRDK